MTHGDHAFTEYRADGTSTPVVRTIAAERPVAIELNGLGYAVMMATPADLADFVHGFCLSERLVAGPEDITHFDTHETAEGTLARVTLRPELAERVADRVRTRVSESSCGLCGIENLEQALRPLPPLVARSRATPAAIFRALAQLKERQPLGAATRAVHAAALCTADGTIRLVREDVGRHNAFDKLIGAMARARLAWDGGFALLTARCSYELVEKAVLATCPLLATISLPTGLALERAGQAGLRLAVLARDDALLWR